MAVDSDAEHLALHPTIEALDHAVSFRGVGSGRAVLDRMLPIVAHVVCMLGPASGFEGVGREAGSASVSRCVTEKGRDATASPDRPVARRQILPRRACGQDPEHAVEDPTVILGGRPVRGFCGGSSGAICSHCASVSSKRRIPTAWALAPPV